MCYKKNYKHPLRYFFLLCYCSLVSGVRPAHALAHHTFPHQHFGLVHFLTDLADAAQLPALHRKVVGAAGDLEQEVPQHVHAPLGQIYLWVKLRPVELLLLVSDT